MPRFHDVQHNQLFERRYRLLALAGTGGMARVYKAYDIKMERLVALKVMRREFADDTKLFSRFVDEARAAAQLDNAHLIRVYDWNATSDRTLCYIAMEYVPGRDLRQIMELGGSFPPSMATRIALEACEALAEAHSHGIVHGDIKPSNILLRRNGHAVVSDFGVARMGFRNRGTTASTAGTLPYMSPEQMDGVQAGPASDLFALGVTLFELLCDQLPYAKMDRPDATLLRHWLAHDPVPSKCSQAMGSELDDIVRTAMCADPVGRFTSALAMRDALAQVASQLVETEANTFGLGNPLRWSLAFLTSNGSMGNEFVIDHPLVLGSDVSAELSIASPLIAARQAYISPAGCMLRVRNMGPSGSLLVDDETVEESWCTVGDVIRMGNTRLKVGCSLARHP